MVHVITLQQTDFNCPHWYTEGLAVWSEEAAAAADSGTNCSSSACRKGSCSTCKRSTSVSPGRKSSDDWQMAYCQAELYVEYMLARGGEESLRKMLAAYAEGSPPPTPIRRVFGVSEEEFEQGYVEFLKQQTAELSTLKYPPKDELSKLLKEQRENPKMPTRLPPWPTPTWLAAPTGRP